MTWGLLLIAGFLSLIQGELVHSNARYSTDDYGSVAGVFTVLGLALIAGALSWGMFA